MDLYDDDPAQHSHLLRIKPLKGCNIILSAARHNLRALQAERGAASHIDVARIPFNRILAGEVTPEAIALNADQIVTDAGLMFKRKDAIRGVELIVSLRPNSPIDHEAFFADSLVWVRDHFAVPVLSAIVHNDEAAPHMHVLLSPLKNGRLNGSALIGYKGKLYDMHRSFYEQVGQRYGLLRPKPPVRMSASDRKKSSELVYTALVSNPDLLTQSGVEKVILDGVSRDPVPWLQALGMAVPTPKPKGTFTGTMIKPVKPDRVKPKGFASGQSGNVAPLHREVMPPKPIGFDSEPPAEDRNLSCVGFQCTDADISTDDAPDSDSLLVRQRDDEQRADYWDEVRGEFIQRKTACSSDNRHRAPR